MSTGELMQGVLPLYTTILRLDCSCELENERFLRYNYRMYTITDDIPFDEMVDSLYFAIKIGFYGEEKKAEVIKTLETATNQNEIIIANAYITAYKRYVKDSCGSVSIEKSICVNREGSRVDLRAR